MGRVVGIPDASGAWLAAMNGMAPCMAKKASMRAQQSSSAETLLGARLPGAPVTRISVSCIDQRRAGRGNDGRRPHDHVLCKAEGDVDHIVGVKELVRRLALLDLPQRQLF